VIAGFDIEPIRRIPDSYGEAPFAPHALELELAMVWLETTSPETQLNPHHSQTDVQVVAAPEWTVGIESQIGASQAAPIK
jgi:hypothetical protein